MRVRGPERVRVRVPALPSCWLLVIQESDSPWSQPLVIVTKKDGSPRFCVDFRKLNCMTKKQIFPMPRVDEVLDSLVDSCYFTTLDLASGYWQIPLKPEDREKTVFCTRQGNFEFRVMPMGLVNASYSFQKNDATSP